MNKKININIWDEKFTFTGEILMKHLRKIQPLSKKMENSEISELDFFIELALVLCESENSGILEEKIDSLNLKWIEKFTKDFKPILDTLNNFNKKSLEEKKR